jgi:hypothetical protein
VSFHQQILIQRENGIEFYQTTCKHVFKNFLRLEINYFRKCLVHVSKHLLYGALQLDETLFGIGILLSRKVVLKLSQSVLKPALALVTPQKSADG